MPPAALLPPYMLTLAISFLVGIGLREYYEGEQKFDTFGTVRTFVFIGMLGFVLFQLPEIGRFAYLAGFAALAVFLVIYYADKINPPAGQKKSPGMIGILIALLTYATGQPATPMDQPAIEAIVKGAAKDDYGLRSLLHGIVQSETFRSK